MSVTAALFDVIARHRLLLAACGILAFLAAGWVASVAASATEERTLHDESTAWVERAGYSYAVPITRNSTHWPLGTVLPMGEPAYFRTVSERIDITFTWAPERSDAGALVAAARMVANVRAEGPDGRAYWTIEHELANATTREGTLALHATLDLDALAREVEQVSMELPAGGTLNWTVRTMVAYALELPDGVERGNAAYVLELRAADPRFSLPGADELAWERPHVRTRSYVVRHEAGWGAALASPGALGLVLGGALLVAVALRRPPTPDALAERELRRYRDWISLAANEPAYPAGTPLVEVASLEDLVHVASEARTRVLLHEPSRTYFALLSSATYRYRPANLPSDA